MVWALAWRCRISRSTKNASKRAGNRLAPFIGGSARIAPHALLAAVAIRINLAEDAGGPKAPEVVETTGYLEWGGQTNGSSGSSGGLCSVVAGAYCLRASSNNCML